MGLHIPCALITGASGGIGKALCTVFQASGYRVLGTDRVDDHASCDEFIPLDLKRFVADARIRRGFRQRVRKASAGQPLSVLINNAAQQIVGDTADLGADDLRTSLEINLEAPFLMICTLLENLEHSKGCIINIGSVHSLLTKPGFVAYAASKAGLEGLTRALAVDLGSRGIRVNLIRPAATRTRMLEEGFRGRSKKLAELARHHPLGRIGEPSEIAELALFLASDRAHFISGASVDIGGGVSARLHDPG